MMKLKKVFVIIMAAVMALSLLSGCAGQSTQGNDPDVTTLKVGFDKEFPPYGYVDDNGEYTGFDIECARILCERLGWELVLQPIDWDAKDLELESGAINCIWNGFTMTGRENDYTWSEPYVDNTQVVMVRADSAIETLADLAGATVMVQADSSALAAVSKDENADLLASFGELMECGDYQTAVMDLEQGAVDAIIVDVGVARFQMEGTDTFRILDESVDVEQYAIGFLLGNTELRDAVQAEFSAMLADGTAAQIAEEFGVTLIG